MAEKKAPCPELNHIPGDDKCKEARRHSNLKCLGCTRPPSRRDRRTRNQKERELDRGRVIRLPPQRRQEAR